MTAANLSNGINNNFWFITSLGILNQPLYLDVSISNSALVSEGQFISIQVHGHTSVNITCSDYNSKPCSNIPSQCIYNYDITKYVQNGNVNITFAAFFGNITFFCTSTSVYSLNMKVQTLAIPTPQPTVYTTQMQIPTQSFCSSVGNRDLEKKTVILYVLFTLGFMGVGVLIHMIRKTNTKLIKFSLLMMAAEMSILGLDIITDIIYIFTLYVSYKYYGIATTMLVIRIIHPFSSIYIFLSIAGRGKINEYYSELIDNEDLARNAKLYGIIFVTAVVELTSIKFLPWLESEYSKKSGGYPDLFMFRLCGYSKMIQSLISALLQLISLTRLNHDFESGTCAVIITITFISTLLVAFATVFEIAFQSSNTKKTQDNKESDKESEMSVIRIDEMAINPFHMTKGNRV